MKNENFDCRYRKKIFVVDHPIRKEKDIKAVLQLLFGKPRDLLLFTMGINNVIRAEDIYSGPQCQDSFLFNVSVKFG